MSAFFTIETIALTGAGGAYAFSDLGNGPSVNDNGFVAFMGTTPDGADSEDNIYSWNSDDNEPTRLMNGFFMESNAGSSPRQTFSPEVQINNANEVLAQRRLDAIVQVGFPFGVITSQPLTYLESWDADPGLLSVGLPIRQWVMGDGGAGPSGPLLFYLNPIYTRLLPSSFNQTSGFAGVYNFASQNDQGQVAFGGLRLESGRHVNYLITTPRPSGFPYLGIGTPGYAARPMLANDGTIVVRNGDATSGIFKLNFNLGAIQNVAGVGAGFSQVSHPNISDDGRVITFTAQHASDGPGVYVAISDPSTGNYSSPVKVMGLSHDDRLDPGERWVRPVGDPSWQSRIDVGGFTSISLDARPGVNHWFGPNSTDYFVAFEGAREGAGNGLHGVVVDLSDPAHPRPRDFVTIVESGDSVPGLANPVSDFALHDSVNNSGQVAFWAQAGGQEAILLATPAPRIDRWWATAGDGAISVNYMAKVPESGLWCLDLDFGSSYWPADWSLSAGAQVTIRGPGGVDTAGFGTGLFASSFLGHLDAGYYNLQIDGIVVPDHPAADALSFQLHSNCASSVDVSQVSSTFIADVAEPDLFAAGPITLTFPSDDPNQPADVTIGSLEELVDRFRPTLLFDGGNQASGGPERFQVPFSTGETWENGRPRTGQSTETIDLSRYATGTYTPENTKPEIPASVVVRNTASGRQIAINYHLQYPRSNWNEHGGVNTHESDWEGIGVFLDESSPDRFTPQSVAYGQHVQFRPVSDGGISVGWSDSCRASDGYRPLVYVGLGGHASYPESGSSPWLLPYPSREYHQGDASAYEPLEDDVRYMARVGDGGSDEWLLYPGLWGRIDAGTPVPLTSQGDDGIPGPVFIDSGFGVGVRWFDPWEWADGFDVRQPITLNNWLTLGNVVVLNPLDCSNRAWQLTEGSDAAIQTSLAVDPLARHVAFDYRFTQPGDGDRLELRVDGQLVWSVGGLDYVGPGFERTPLIDVSAFAGGSADIELRLATLGGVNSQVILDNLTVGLREAPDLSVELAYAPSVLPPGSGLPVTLTVRNEGPGRIDSTDSAAAQVVLSSDAVIGNGDDILLTELEIPGDAQPGALLQLELIPALPDTVPAGDYFVAAIVDPGDLVSEADESNNVWISAAADLTISGAANIPPQAAADSFDVPRDLVAALDVLANDMDADGVLRHESLRIVDSPAHGRAVVDAQQGLIEYTPTAGYFGADSFTYVIADESWTWSPPALVSLVVGDGAPPSARDDMTASPVDTPVDIDILANDSDPEGALDRTSVRLVALPGNGTADVDPVTGVVSYAPAAGFTGADFFKYAVRDASNQESNAAIVSIQVGGTTNQSPLAADDIAEGAEDEAIEILVLTNDSDADGVTDPTTVDILVPPAHGTLNVDPDTGAVTYDPAPDFFGSDSFEYAVRDDDGAVSNAATVAITVLPVNDAPVARDDSADTSPDAVVSISVLANDSDVDGTLDSTSVVIVSSPAHGVIQVDPQTGHVSYSPDAGFVGEDSFTYQMRDDLGALSNAAVVNVAVRLAWHNADKPLDVDADTVIASIDALIIINELNDRRFSDPVGRLPAQRPPQAMFLDVNADGYAASDDALIVVNWLNGISGPEGESVDARVLSFDGPISSDLELRRVDGSSTKTDQPRTGRLDTSETPPSPNLLLDSRLLDDVWRTAERWKSTRPRATGRFSSFDRDIESLDEIARDVTRVR